MLSHAPIAVRAPLLPSDLKAASTARRGKRATALPLLATIVPRGAIVRHRPPFVWSAQMVTMLRSPSRPSASRALPVMCLALTAARVKFATLGLFLPTVAAAVNLVPLGSTHQLTSLSALSAQRGSSPLRRLMSARTVPLALMLAPPRPRTRAPSARLESTLNLWAATPVRSAQKESTPTPRHQLARLSA